MNKKSSDLSYKRTNSQSIGGQLDDMIKAPDALKNKQGASPLETSSKIIQSKGWDYIFNTVEQDTHFSSVLATRANDLVAHGFKILPAMQKINGRPTAEAIDREIADFVSYALESVEGSFLKDIVAMMTHISRGFSISEKNWRFLDSGKYQGKVALRDIRFKRQDLFSFKFDEFGRYQTWTVGKDKILIPQSKIIHLISGFDDENPYGEAVADKCAFWVWMKLNGVKYWAIHQERFGSPLTALEVGDDVLRDPVKQKIATEILRACEEDTGIQIPKGMSLKYIEALRSGDAGYSSFYEITNREISKAVLGSTLTNDMGKSGMGNHATAKVHSDTTSIFFNFDMISVQSILNYQLIKQIVDYNYPGIERYPRLVWDCFDASSFVSAAQGIAALAALNCRIPSSWVNEVLNIPYPDAEEEILSILNSAGIQTPSISGVDNKALSHSHTTPTSFAESDTDKKIAKNEKIISQYASLVADEWISFANELAGKKSFYDADLYRFQELRLSPFYEKVLVLGHLRGLDDASQEIKSADYSASSLVSSFAYRPFEDIIADYLKRKVITRQQYDELSALAKRKSFTIASVDSEAVIKKIKDKLLTVLRGDTSVPEFHDLVMGVFEAAGLTSINNRHIEVVMRNNLNSQYTDGRFEVFDSMDRSEFPALQVLAILDSSVRDSHARLHEYTRPADDDVWSWLRPPFGHNCRCTIRAVHYSEDYTISDWIPDESEYTF